MASFVANGHSVKLHVYEEVPGVPSGVMIVDAAAVLSRDRLFAHRKTGSFAQFADWFRYRLLHAQGGIWADTDVVCLQALRYAHEEIFAWQDDELINIAVLGLAVGHPLAAWMAACCDEPNRVLPYDGARQRRRKWRRRWLQGNRRSDVKWDEFGPRGFTQAARHLGFTHRALPAKHFYAVPFERWCSVFENGPTNWDGVLAESRCLHLWNEMLRRDPTFDKNARFPDDSLFERLCRQYLKDDSLSTASRR